MLAGEPLSSEVIEALTVLLKRGGVTSDQAKRWTAYYLGKDHNLGLRLSLHDYDQSGVNFGIEITDDEFRDAFEWLQRHN